MRFELWPKLVAQIERFCHVVNDLKTGFFFKRECGDIPLDIGDLTFDYVAQWAVDRLVEGGDVAGCVERRREEFNEELGRVDFGDLDVELKEMSGGPGTGMNVGF